MIDLPYDKSRDSLYTPGKANDFFQLGAIQNEVMLCAEMSRLAYVKDKNRLIDYLKRADFQLDKTINYDNNGTQLFIASKLDLTIVAFRGTEFDDLLDLIIDTKFTLSYWTDPLGNVIGKVHTGSLKSLLNRNFLQDKKYSWHDIVIELRELRKSSRLLLTGHSLGAQLATLTASWVAPSHLYTFGSPRVGDRDFKYAMRNIKHTRCVNCCDIVTRSPPNIFWLNYVNLDKLLYIDRNGKIQTDFNSSDIKKDCKEARIEYNIKSIWKKNAVLLRDIADHAPINYVSAILGIRT